MNWLLLILLTVFGGREHDAKYEKACGHLDAVTGGYVTCARLEAWADAAREDAAEDAAEDDDGDGISNGF